MSGLRRLELDPPIPFDEAVARVKAALRPLGGESIALAEAAGRVLAENVDAEDAVPPFDNSMVDGFAVLASDVASATPEHPVELTVSGEAMAGGGEITPVRSGTAVRTMTGAPLPPGADSLVMLEWTSSDERRVLVERPTAPGRFVRRAGEDMAPGDRVLEAGARLGPAAIGVLASVGRERVLVGRQPRVAVLATGDELVDLGEPLTPGRIRSSNNWTLAGQAREAGARVQPLGIARDEDADLHARLDLADGADVLLTSGGVSVGDRDRVQDVLRARGLEPVFWRVLSSPGKPLLFGRIAGMLVFGVPGNPVSSMVAFENFVRPSLLALQGFRGPSRPRVRARLTARIAGPEDRRHFARVRVSWVGEEFIADEVHPHGSGNLRSMLHANALAVLPEGVGAAEPGERVDVILLGDPDSAPA
jgi:molybdopterin molybdotransferase